MPEDDSVVAWLRENRYRIASLTSSDDFEDLVPFEALRQARIVAFGDPTHGTKEFYQLRARFLKYLISRGNARALAIECSASAAESINEFLLDGRGEITALVTDLRSAMWDVEEFIETLHWLRVHNASQTAAGKVRFVGLDIWNTEPARWNIFKYLQSVGVADSGWVGDMFALMGAAELWGIGAAGRWMPDSLLDQARQLVALFVKNRDPWTIQSSKEEYGRARCHSEWILEWIAANKSELAHTEVPGFLPHTQGLNGAFRSMCMANHLCSLADLPGTDQIVVWAHSYHAGTGIEDENGTRAANMGALLKERWGNGYYAVLFECNQGRFLARRRNPDDTLGEFLCVSIPRAPKDSLPDYLSRVDGPVFGLDLRGSTIPPVVESWLRARRKLHAMGWACSEPPHLYLERAIKPLCDALLYIEETTPTTPTQNARFAVAKGLTN